MTKDIDISAFARACDYPHVTPDMFEASSLVRIDQGEIIRDEKAQRTLIGTSPFSARLPDTNIYLPSYDVILGGNGKDRKVLTDRVAIIGIGSNCSPDILLEKFQKAKIGGEFFLAQATLENHAVVHGAFLGGKGTVPATVMPHQGTKSHITVGFFDIPQAIALTGTEPNYDLVQMKSALTLRGLNSSTALAHGGMLYVSVWGGLTIDGKNPLAHTAIPSETSLQKMDTIGAVHEVARILGKDDDVPAFFDSIPSMSVGDRLSHIFRIQAENALPASFAGTPVKKATIAGQCTEGTPAPLIQYL